MNNETNKKREVTVHIGNGSPMVTQHFDRNSRCRCGSGKKTKNCCGQVIKFYHSKPDKKPQSITSNNENHE